MGSAEKCVLGNRGFRVNAKKCLHEGVIGAWGGEGSHRRCSKQRHGV